MRAIVIAVLAVVFLAIYAAFDLRRTTTTTNRLGKNASGQTVKLVKLKSA